MHTMPCEVRTLLSLSCRCKNGGVYTAGREPGECASRPSPRTTGLRPHLETGPVPLEYNHLLLDHRALRQVEGSLAPRAPAHGSRLQTPNLWGDSYTCADTESRDPTRISLLASPALSPFSPFSPFRPRSPETEEENWHQKQK